MIFSFRKRAISLARPHGPYVVAHNTASGINQIDDSPGIGRSIEGKVAAWRIVEKTTNVSTGRHHHCLNPKHVRERKDSFFCYVNGIGSDPFCLLALDHQAACKGWRKSSLPCTKVVGACQVFLSPVAIACFSPERHPTRWGEGTSASTTGKECALKLEKSVSLKNHLHIRLGNVMVLQAEGCFRTFFGQKPTLKVQFRCLGIQLVALSQLRSFLGRIRPANAV